MSKNVSRNIDPVAVFAAMKPAGLDEAAHQSYSRRRGGDLAGALRDAAPAAGRQGQARGNHRVVFGLGFAAAATAAVVAAGFAVPALTGRDRVMPSPARQTTHAAVNASAFLLVSADRVEKSSTGTGAYWHAEERIFARAGTKPKAGKKTTYLAYATTTLRTWWSRDGRWHSDAGLDPMITFATPADEAAWKAAGSPALSRVGHNDDDSPMKFTIGGAQLSLAQLQALPTDPTRLRVWLHTNYQADHEGLDEDSAVYARALDILTTPTTVGTRAALYRVLAELPGVQLVGTVHDPLGRIGTAVSRLEPGPGNQMSARRLVIEPETGALLAQTLYPGADGAAEPIFWEAWRELGWTGTFGG